MIKHQHGDLILYATEGIPKTAKRIDAKDGFVVERGEGVHLHYLETVDGVAVYQDDETLYLHVDKPTKLIHEEHGCQVLEPGVYKKVIEREWDYESEEARKTLD